MDSAPRRPALVTLGYVARANGLRGAVVVHSDPSMASVFRKGLAVELVPRTGDPIHTRIQAAAPVRAGLRVAFENVTDRNQAEALVGASLVVPREQLRFEEGEYLESDLVGLEVVTGEGKSLGRIVEVIATGANDIYAVRAEDGSEILIPAVAHAVLGVDLHAGRVTVAADALEYGQAPRETPRQTPKDRA